MSAVSGPGSLVQASRCRGLLAEMIAIASVNPSLVPGGAGEREMARYMAGVLGELGFAAAVEGPSAERPNAVGVWPGTGGGRSLMVVGHLDTVGTAGMTCPALEATFDGDRVHGRGAADMKGGLAAMLAAVEALVKGGFRLRGDLILAGVADEEYASLGIEDLVRRHGAAGGIIAEPSGLGVITAHKGFGWINVDVKGRAAHGSDFEHGVDAITRAGRVLMAYERHQREVLSHVAGGPTSRPSVHAALIRGGRELSTYADHCRISFERRTVPGETGDSVAREVEGLLDALRREDPAFEAAAEVFFYRPAYQVERDAPVVRALARAVELVTGAAPEYGASGGWMDSAVMGAAGIPTVIYGPRGGGAHGPDEWVSLSSVVEVARVLAAAAAEFCGLA